MPGTITYVYITTMEEKYVMNLEDSKGGLQGGKGRKKIYNYNLTNKNIINVSIFSENINFWNFASYK